jgi:hypothetical protein
VDVGRERGGAEGEEQVGGFRGIQLEDPAAGGETVANRRPHGDSSPLELDLGARLEAAAGSDECFPGGRSESIEEQRLDGAARWDAAAVQAGCSHPSTVGDEQVVRPQ